MAEQLRDRIVIFAGEFARGDSVQRLSNSGECDLDRRDHVRSTRHRLQRMWRLQNGKRFR
ncbi:MAG: hypothetical protein WBW99_10640 [Pseudolabrys sp.]